MPAKNIQIFNVLKYASNYIPEFLRKPKLLAYLYALLSPFQTYRDRLRLETYPELERRTRYNAQVARFERLLNTLFNVNTIYIDESSVNLHVYTYNEDELQPLYLYNEGENMPVYLYNQTEFLPIYDFTVHVPQALYNTQLPRINSIIRKYKLVGVTYNVVPIPAPNQLPDGDNDIG